MVIIISGLFLVAVFLLVGGAFYGCVNVRGTYILHHSVFLRNYWCYGHEMNFLLLNFCLKLLIFNDCMCSPPTSFFFLKNSSIYFLN